MLRKRVVGGKKEAPSAGCGFLLQEGETETHAVTGYFPYCLALAVFLTVDKKLIVGSKTSENPVRKCWSRALCGCSLRLNIQSLGLRTELNYSAHHSERDRWQTGPEIAFLEG